MNDLISREAAINAIRRKYNENDSDYPTMYQMGLHDANVIIEELPAAQLETPERTEKSSQNVPNDDLISRKAAIEVASGYCHPANVADEIRKLPSAQTKRVKCAHCKKYDTHNHRCKHWNHRVSNVDWCSYAERKEYEQGEEFGDAMNDANKKGGMGRQEWMMFLLTDIALSLARIVDVLEAERREDE